MSTAATAPSRRRRAFPDTPDAEETNAVFTRLAELPEGPEKMRLRDELTRAWLPMAVRLALRFRDRGESMDDLKQVAALGLVKAIGGYRPERGSAFESYAIPTIVGEVKRHFRDCTWGVHVPRRVQELRNTVRLAVRELSAASDSRFPTVAEIAERTRLCADDVILGLEAIESYKTLSLDAERPGADDDFALRDSIGFTESQYELVLARETVRDGLRGLPERERRILYMRFFCDMTQSRIGEELGLSQMHVCRLIKRTCARIREQADGTGPEAPASSVAA
ncbi:RNA polymerase subunit sigma [Streptomyces sp. CB02923]|nr:SigB/SigF/SigG family RNA polymerase sigma factor [Streptomyces sp. CB02923]OKI06287.1 RNA polymerase subunit sigma [Streptomyces sp. CB02923]